MKLRWTFFATSKGNRATANNYKMAPHFQDLVQHVCLIFASYSSTSEDLPCPLKLSAFQTAVLLADSSGLEAIAT